MLNVANKLENYTCHKYPFESWLLNEYETYLVFTEVKHLKDVLALSLCWKNIEEIGSTNASTNSDIYSKQHTELIPMRNNVIPRNDYI